MPPSLVDLDSIFDSLNEVSRFVKERHSLGEWVDIIFTSLASHTLTLVSEGVASETNDTVRFCRSEGVWFGAAACAHVCPQKRMRAVYSAEVTFLAYDSCARDVTFESSPSRTVKHQPSSDYGRHVRT